MSEAMFGSCPPHVTAAYAGYGLVERPPARARIVFLTYQRTTFTDALRVAARLQQQGAYEPVFLVCRGKRSLVEPQIEECARRGIRCITEEEALIPPMLPSTSDTSALLRIVERAKKIAATDDVVSQKKTTIWLKLRQRVEILLAILSHLIGRQRCERMSGFWRRTAFGDLFVRRARRRAFALARDPGRKGLFAALLCAETNYRRILNALAPAVVCLSEDIPGTFSAPFIRAARRKGIPSVIIPFTIPNVLELAEACLSRKVSWPMRLDELAAALAYPSWTLRHKGKLLLRANPGLIHAIELSGLAPPDPWMTNSGNADRIAVESERMLEVYRKAGFPEHQLVLTGSCADDLLHAALREKETRRAKLYRELELSNDRPMLLSSLVPDQLGSGVPCCEFSDYGALIEFWVSTLAAWHHRMHVVLKINPRYRREEFLHLEKWGVKVAPHDTIDLLPLAEIYVTSISSTLRWAAACGIPSINYDVYHYRYGDFNGVPCIVHFEKRAQFQAVLARLIEDEAARADLRRLQRTQAPRWGYLDGKSTERLVGLLDELCRGGRLRRWNQLQAAQPLTRPVIAGLA
jgi:hypothetical protein